MENIDNAMGILQGEIKRLRANEREAKSQMAYLKHEIDKAERDLDKLGNIINVLSTVIGHAVTIPTDEYMSECEPQFRIYENGELTVIIPEKAYEEMEESFRHEYIEIRSRKPENTQRSTRQTKKHN